MSKSPYEKEVKFYLADPVNYEERLRSLGGRLVQPRVREFNYRFDTPDMDLAHSGRALRLRKDSHNILTFKGPSGTESGVRVRPEVEVQVDDIESARGILKGLGYVVVVCYEKWRTTYTLNDLEITLDELPYGSFSEIEGSEPVAIQLAAAALGLNWDTRIQVSYLELFTYIKKKLSLPVTNLTFSEFKNIPLSYRDLGVTPADMPGFL